MGSVWGDMDRRLLLAIATAFLAACDSFPRDPRSTLESVRAQGNFAVGYVASARSSNVDPKTGQLLRSISAATGASPTVAEGETDPLLLRLEEGQLDLVVGWFDKKSPWSSRVTFGPALETQRIGSSELLLRPVMQNGENGWISLVEGKARDVGPEGQ